MRANSDKHFIEQTAKDCGLSLVETREAYLSSGCYGEFHDKLKDMIKDKLVATEYIDLVVKVPHFREGYIYSKNDVIMFNKSIFAYEPRPIEIKATEPKGFWKVIRAILKFMGNTLPPLPVVLYYPQTTKSPADDEGWEKL